MAANFQLWLSPAKLTSIIYLGENISPEYREKLQALGRHLGDIPIFECVPGGILNPRFVLSWNRKLQESGYLPSKSSSTAPTNPHHRRKRNKESDGEEEEEEEEEEKDEEEDEEEEEEEEEE